MPIPVTVDNFTRAETDTMIRNMLPIIGGLGVFHHDRELSPLDQQPVIRQNRDTLYSVAIVDIADGATLTIPETAGRYLSVMVINQDHYINRVFHEAGRYELARAEFGTDLVVIAARILFDPASEADLAEVHRLQDGLTIEAAGQRVFDSPDYDTASHTEVRDALLVLGRTIGGLSHCFGRASDVDPVRHLVGTALGWGGLPDDEAQYLNIEPGLPRGRYTMTFGADVPADAFWSLSVYNGAGYFEPGPSGLTNVNSVFAVKNDDGTTTIHLGDWGDETPNRIPLPEGWNLLVRLYRPRLDDLANWRVPEIVAV
ncbi:DUF1214 domain-containing protein [Agromyces sp. H3Y2-19a]|uniref:DUF1214 domain-containing protein n=1 Tax=Agromyces chromiiresistens TaxID=3030835 RepID=UPI0023B99352|nr:DUF1214 domain-containing protein [Agromyces chromiiresistens]MDF0515487.1 DUF1214 domain-containing protein [Agromyces chromiiresistens]